MKHNRLIEEKPKKWLNHYQHALLLHFSLQSTLINAAAILVHRLSCTCCLLSFMLKDEIQFLVV